MLSLSEPSEKVLMNVLRQTSPLYQKIWEEIDFEMKESMYLLAEELNLGRVRRSFMQLYWWYLSKKMIGAAHQGMNLQDIEGVVSEISRKISNEDIKLPFLRNRAQRSFYKIKHWIQGITILDFGCGDGMIQKSTLSHINIQNKVSINIYSNEANRRLLDQLQNVR